MIWGILVILVITIVIAYVIIQETRAHRYWRKLVAEGDVSAITTLVQQEIERWRTQRTPKDVPASLWHGVQTVELQSVGRDYVRVSAAAEAQYAMVEGKRQEVSSALHEGMKLSVKLADMLLYDIPNVCLARVQTDIYTTFRDMTGLSTQQCILSAIYDRQLLADLDWDSQSPEEIIAFVGGRFYIDALGAPRPIDPDEGAVDAEQRDPPCAEQDRQSKVME